MSTLYLRLRACAALLLVGAALPAQAATILVTSNSDVAATDGNCTLREAVTAANTNAAVDACLAGSTTGDTILFTAITGQTVTLTGGQLDVTDGVAIGDGVSAVTIVATAGARHFRLSLTAPVEAVSLRNVTLRGGSGFIGGAVLVADGQPTTFTTVTFDQNTSAASGGALRVGTGTHTVTGCTFSANTTTVAGVTDGGGAVYNNGGTLTVNQSTFTGNTALAGTANGGAILNGFGGTLSVAATTGFTGNQAARAGGAIETAGTLAVDGGSFASNTAGINGGAVHITGTVTATFTGTTVFNLNTAAQEGGAVWNSATGTLSMTGSQVTNNTAAGPAADQGGGGVFSDGGVTTLTTLTITGNRATGAAGSGGGVQNTAGGRMTISGGTISTNTAVRAGGGVETNLSGTATVNTLGMTNVTVSGNNAGTAPGFGGGVHVSGAAVVTVTGGTVSGNTAVEGGGVWKAAPGTLTISGTAITGNTATGALATNGGGGVFSDGGTGLSVSGATITGNMATGAAGSGGGLFNDLGATSTVSNTTFSNNTAVRAGGAIEDNAGTRLTLTNVTMTGNTAGTAPGNGGGLHLTGGGTVVMTGGTVARNTAVEGGGLWKSAGGTLSVAGTLIDDNTATGADADQGGGGVYNDGAGGLLTLTNLTVSNNDATGAAGSGGGLLNNVGATSRIRGVRFMSNTSRRAGGAIEDNAGAMLTVVGGAMDGNTTGGAPGNGGGVHITGAGTVVMDSTMVLNNVAASQGGGVWNSGLGRMTVRFSTLQGNRAATGGGVYQVAGLKGLTSVENSLVFANVASAAGGGLAADGATVIVENTTVSSNRAANGGGLASGGGRFLMSSVTVALNTATTAGGGIFRITAMGDSLISPDNTLVADNTAPTGPGIAGVVMSRGYNLFENVSGATIMRDEPAGPDLIEVESDLQPLASNGGPTPTHALLASSPAARAGMTGLVVDQRGFTRQTRASIGAYEVGGQPVAGEDGPVAGTASAFGMTAAAPNPTRSSAALRVTVAASEPVEVALYDALGRRVQTLYSGTPAAEQTLDIRVDAAGLAPGVYVVRATSASAVATQRITVVR